MLIALTAWFGSLPFVDLGGLDDYGLLFRMPPTFLLAVGLLLAGFAVAAREDSERAGRLMLMYCLALVVVLYATIPTLYDEPRYAFVYKHIAVIHYIEEHGAVDRGVDIYQNWPGFFAMNAALSEITGVDALRYANWSQVLFPVADLLALRFLFGGFTDDRRRIHIALLFFLVGAWVEYSYLAPQALGLFATLMILGLAVRCLRPHPEQWHQRLLAVVSRRRPPAPQPFPVPAWAAVALILALSVVVVTSHQLTPFFLVLNLALLVLGRRTSGWWLPIAITVLFVAWTALSWDYLATHFPTLLGGSPVENAQPTTHSSPGEPSAGVQFVGTAARGLSAVLAVLAAAGAWREFRRGRPPVLLAMLAATPALLIFVQSYGGEGIYRIYLFMTPWLAFLAAALFTGPRLRTSAARATALLAAASVSALLFLTAYYGLEQENHLSSDEVAVTRWFDRNTPSDSVLMLVISNHPYPISGDYDKHLAPFGHYSLEVLTDDAWVNRPLGTADVDRLHEYVASSGPTTYLLLSPAQIAYAENHGYARPGDLPRFFADVVRSPRFEVVHRDGESYLLRAR
ncbi:hypothetical protein GCM10009539_00940 [Cryptosporangium japonicum]|uniref:Glycosyltransferase RgtA/B/C/D-like domain-containing protein n=1 Tax=Cryptosporangium japonicum TaxID=80872 RepID=A0ABP3CZL3_9ACTN